MWLYNCSHKPITVLCAGFSRYDITGFRICTSESSLGALAGFAIFLGSCCISTRTCKA